MRKVYTPSIQKKVLFWSLWGIISFPLHWFLFTFLFFDGQPWHPILISAITGIILIIQFVLGKFFLNIFDFRIEVNDQSITQQKYGKSRTMNIKNITGYYLRFSALYHTYSILQLLSRDGETLTLSRSISRKAHKEILQFLHEKNIPQLTIREVQKKILTDTVTNKLKGHSGGGKEALQKDTKKKMRILNFLTGAACLGFIFFPNVYTFSILFIFPVSISYALLKSFPNVLSLMKFKRKYFLISVGPFIMWMCLTLPFTVAVQDFYIQDYTSFWGWFLGIAFVFFILFYPFIQEKKHLLILGAWALLYSWGGMLGVNYYFDATDPLEVRNIPIVDKNTSTHIYDFAPSYKIYINAQENGEIPYNFDVPKEIYNQIRVGGDTVNIHLQQGLLNIPYIELGCILECEKEK